MQPPLAAQQRDAAELSTSYDGTFTDHFVHAVQDTQIAALNQMLGTTTMQPRLWAAACQVAEPAIPNIIM